MKLIVLLLGLSSASLCSTPYEPYPPQATSDAGDPDSCAAACENLRALGCPDGQPSGGDTCEAKCENAENSGLATVHPACLARITACDQEDRCE